MEPIPVYRTSLTGNERAYVLDCLQTNWVSSKGDYIGRFEREFAEFVDVPHAAAVCNGTAALHLALLALGIGPGDEVLVPTLTYIASVNAISYVGATPVFVDSLATTWQMDPDDVRRRVTKRTRAILAVHLYGHPCDLAALREIADEHGLYLIEDCAEAFGSRLDGRHVGNHGDIATFSFYGNKTITTGEGGMVVTADAALHERVLKLKGQGLASGREYWHDEIGFNYRMTNLCAALGLAQLERAEEILLRKRRVAELYKKQLRNTDFIVQPESDGVTHSYWMVSALVPHCGERDPMREHLTQAGIETRPLFYPIHEMPMYRRAGQRFPIAQDLAGRGITLPSFPELTPGQIEFICEHLQQAHQSAWAVPCNSSIPHEEVGQQGAHHADLS